MAALSALAERPSRIDHFFESDVYNEHGIYALNIYSLGVPFTQVIDDRLPVFPGSTQLIFAKPGKDMSIWAALAEKAFAKWYGSWERLVGGWMAYAVASVNGSPYEQLWHKDHAGNLLYTEEAMWDILK
jgi:hypothetical protein